MQAIYTKMLVLRYFYWLLDIGQQRLKLMRACPLNIGKLNDSMRIRFAQAAVAVTIAMVMQALSFKMQITSTGI